MNDEEIINETFREVTGCTNANAISWVNVGKPVCLKIMQKARADERQKLIELIENKFKWTSLKSPKKWKQIKQLAQSEDKTQW